MFFVVETSFPPLQVRVPCGHRLSMLLAKTSIAVNSHYAYRSWM